MEQSLLLFAFNEPLSALCRSSPNMSHDDAL